MGARRGRPTHTLGTRPGTANLISLGWDISLRNVFLSVAFSLSV